MPFFGGLYSYMTTPVEGEISQKGNLNLMSPAFDEGEMMPDSVGYANENKSPPLIIDNIPNGTQSLVLIMDDPEAESVAGHVWDHWIVYNIDPNVDQVTEGKVPKGGVVTYNDFVEQDWGGPAPPEGYHNYRFKLFALDEELGNPPGIRKARIGSAIMMETEILGQTQLNGRYDAGQGTIF